jgi:hypothetical protein
LGDTFLRSFISVYNFENNSVGFAPHIYSSGSITEHKYVEIYEKKTLLIIIIAVSIVLVLIVNAAVVYKIVKIKNIKKDPENEGADE